MMYLITGGARSGKSRKAQQLACSLTEQPIYIATARIWDEDFSRRVARHQADRSAAWTTMEEQRDVAGLPIENRVAVIDCVTLWLTNFFIDTRQQVEPALDLFTRQIDRLKAKPGHFILVSNEIGMGLHAPTESGRKFTDLQGWANQYLAANADQVLLMVSGLALQLKPAREGCGPC